MLCFQLEKDPGVILYLKDGAACANIYGCTSPQGANNASRIISVLESDIVGKSWSRFESGFCAAVELRISH